MTDTETVKRNVWTITQEVTGGNDFDGTAPSSGGSDVQHQIDEDQYEIDNFTDLDSGGLFDWPRDPKIMEVRRIFLSLGNANDWWIDLVTLDGDDDEWVVERIFEQADFGGDNELQISERVVVTLEREDFLRLHTDSNTTSEIFASMTAAPW